LSLKEDAFTLLLGVFVNALSSHIIHRPSLFYSIPVIREIKLFKLKVIERAKE